MKKILIIIQWTLVPIGAGLALILKTDGITSTFHVGGSKEVIFFGGAMMTNVTTVPPT